ncbi:MAG: class I SAM-dependent methyltransferase [Deltaproteobacteria bacterium]|nr:MAG: class I SAM-dependent methyltransferase [Deltaproteobacteria bacterium]
MADGDRERWDARWRADAGATEPSPFLIALDALLPRAGAALDVAGGTGRNAVWLARRGLDVLCADVSPVALALARERAAAAGVALRTIAVDLETEPLPRGPFALIVAIDFLHRPLLAAVPDALAAGGLLVMSQPTRTNLTRNARPSARFLLDDGELPGLVVGLEVVCYVESWFEDRHEARLMARKAAR